MSRYWRAFRSSSVVMGSPALVVLAALLGFPVLYFLWLSLHRWSGARTIPWDFIGLANYAQALFRDPAVVRALGVTVIFSTGTVVLTLVLGTALALFLNRPFRGRLLVVALLLIPIVSTPVAVSAQWLSMLQLNGLLNGITTWLGLGPQAWLGEPLVLPTLIAIDAARWTPLVTLIILAGLTAMPTEPFEAARIDGASSRQIIRYLTLPLLRPFIAVAAVLRLIEALKTFDEIQIITGGGPAGATRTLYMFAYQQGFTFLNFGYVSAVLALFFVLILILSILVLRLRGTTAG
jgi:multiple sugar transport system permease protein